MENNSNESGSKKYTDVMCYSCEEVKPTEPFDIEYSLCSRIGKTGKYMGDVPLLCDDCIKWLTDQYFSRGKK